MEGKDQRTPANDNRCRHCRTVVAELPYDLPITDHELALIETHFAVMIAELLNDVVNDNAVKAEPGPDRRSEP